ncbi:hypothetical protein PTKIN_Ptkin13bG0178600 [Pterospermum kingtungense]
MDQSSGKRKRNNRKTMESVSINNHAPVNDRTRPWPRRNGPSGQPLTSTTIASAQAPSGLTPSGSGVGQSSKGQLSMNHPGPQGESNSLLNNPELGSAYARTPRSNTESVTLNGSSVSSNASRLMDEATLFMDKVESLAVKYKKVLATSTAWTKDLETLKSTCSKQCREIDSLKTLVSNKDKQNQIARDKIAELENTLKAKEKEAAQASKKVEEATNSLIDRMNMIQSALLPSDLRSIDLQSSQMPKEQNAVQSSAVQLDAMEKKDAEDDVIKLAEDLKVCLLPFSVLPRYFLVSFGNLRIDDMAGPLILQKQKEELHNWIILLETELDEIPALRLEIEQLRESLGQKEEQLENALQLNQTLLVREHQSNDELQVLKEISTCTRIGVKRIGEVDSEPFIRAMMTRYNDEAAVEKALALCSLWEENLRDPHWHPFKTMFFEEEEEHQIIIDEDDEKLKALRNEFGDEVYEAVTNALLEINEHNASGGYVVSELWNFEKDRKASLEEAIQCLIQELHKTKEPADNGTRPTAKGF